MQGEDVHTESAIALQKMDLKKDGEKDGGLTDGGSPGFQTKNRTAPASFGFPAAFSFVFDLK